MSVQLFLIANGEFNTSKKDLATSISKKIHSEIIIFIHDAWESYL